jgi:hypothetical protein
MAFTRYESEFKLRYFLEEKSEAREKFVGKTKYPLTCKLSNVHEPFPHFTPKIETR